MLSRHRWSQGLLFHQAMVDMARAAILMPLGVSILNCKPVNKVSLGFHSYRAEKKSLQILLSSIQAGPGRKVKQEQEEISCNHVPGLFLGSVQERLCFPRGILPPGAILQTDSIFVCGGGAVGLYLTVVAFFVVVVVVHPFSIECLAFWTRCRRRRWPR